MCNVRGRALSGDVTVLVRFTCVGSDLSFPLANRVDPDQAALTSGKQMQKCIKIGITIFKIFIFGGIYYKVGNYVLMLCTCITLKFNF